VPGKDHGDHNARCLAAFVAHEVVQAVLAHSLFKLRQVVQLGNAKGAACRWWGQRADGGGGVQRAGSVQRAWGACRWRVIMIMTCKRRGGVQTCTAGCRGAIPRIPITSRSLKYPLDIRSADILNIRLIFAARIFYGYSENPLSIRSISGARIYFAACRVIWLEIFIPKAYGLPRSIPFPKLAPEPV
jgi:hypothetical protein